MYCTKCGTNNSETATYCRKCGELIEGEDETHVAARGSGEHASPVAESSDGAAIFTIGPTLLFIKAGYVFAAFGAMLLVALLSIVGISPWISILFGLLLFMIPAFYHAKAKLVRYSLTDTQIEVDTGLIGRTTRNIPLRRIQDVTVVTSVMQRLFGFGDLVIDNASEQGGKLILKNINSPRQHADMMLKQMRRLDS
jgi:uncharacterized membrane protein YdbT with pleckstrin-like domain